MEGFYKAKAYDMKIVLSVPGHLRTVPMNNYVFQTLKAMGHDVKLFNFGVQGLYSRIVNKLSKKKFLFYINFRLKKLINTFKPHIFLTIFGFQHDAATIEYIKSKGILTICWWLNDPFQFRRSITQASIYDYYFTNSKGSLDDYKKGMFKNVFYLPVGCYPPLHRKLVDSNSKYDICFAGDWHPIREEILSMLAMYFKVSIFGPWKKKLHREAPLMRNIIKNGFFSPEEMVKIFNRSKIVLNIHTWFGKWNYGINPRLFEANGCGAFQICDYKDEIPKLYEPEKEIVLYKSIEELKEKLSFFLTREKERNDIAEKGFLKTINHYTYEHRLKEMFLIAKISN